jgi:putative GTP pyrophosphokinase
VVGIRIVTYLESTVADVSTLIEAEFAVDGANSLDKGEALGTDRVGYRSKHYVTTLGGQRGALTEYLELRDIPFEIQVRSLLQHAWAEMEHDRRFKYQGDLPDDLKRRFSILAAQLEAADRDFNNLARDIDDRAARTAREATGPESGEKLTVVNTSSYLRGLFAKQIANGIVEPGVVGSTGEQLVAELLRFGIKTLGDLASLVPHDFIVQFPETLAEQTTFLGLVRDAMMLKDAVSYFSKSWNRGWDVISPLTVDMLEKYGVEVAPLLRERGIQSNDGSLDEDDEGEDDSDSDNACGFCGKRAPSFTLTPIGTGGQEALSACRTCVAEMDREAFEDRGA